MQNWLPVWRMNLHVDRDAFETLLLDYFEKDKKSNTFDDAYAKRVGVIELIGGL